MSVFCQISNPFHLISNNHNQNPSPLYKPYVTPTNYQEQANNKPAMAFEYSNAPRPLIGRDGAEPGFWAHAAYENPWPRGSRNSHLGGSTLYKLRQNHLYREPALRESKDKFDGPRFFKAVGDKTVNLEALLAQATGPQPTPGQECISCQRGKGPFVSCVVVPGIFSECANCHWSQQSHRCSFNTYPPESFIPRQQTAPGETGTTSATEIEGDLDRELRETRVARVEAMALVERLNRRIDELLEAKAAQMP